MFRSNSLLDFLSTNTQNYEQPVASFWFEMTRLYLNIGILVMLSKIFTLVRLTIIFIAIGADPYSDAVLQWKVGPTSNKGRPLNKVHRAYVKWYVKQRSPSSKVRTTICSRPRPEKDHLHLATLKLH